MKIPVLLIFLATLLATSHATCLPNPIRLPGDFEYLSDCIPNPIDFLWPKSGSGGLFARQINCRSWRLAVETNNLQKWRTVPTNCVDYVRHYMLGKQYPKDCDVVVDIAIKYAESVPTVGDGKDAWIFDVDETALSNLPYYSRPDVAFGSIPFNRTKFYEWLERGEAPAVPAVLRLCKKLCDLGFKVIFISGTRERIREPLSRNLKIAGYAIWQNLILKGDDEVSENEVEFKSKKRTELVAKGYRIVGNVGDQWSDLKGANAGHRTFKVPNPMYYVG